MVEIKGTTITMTRGDSLVVLLSMTRGGEAYTPSEGDSIRFALKRPAMTPNRGSYLDSEPIITKAIPIDTLQLRLEPSDTKTLAFGEYVYDIEITFADESVDTFIPQARFILAPEVH
ncbi:MAG: hypothetical protein IKF99_09980 [Oscillospiraceae bacterium]|nr:hypothetical protein [Oscillospiraceae bacterium]